MRQTMNDKSVLGKTVLENKFVNESKISMDISKMSGVVGLQTQSEEGDVKSQTNDRQDVKSLESKRT